MIEKRPLTNILCHTGLIISIIILSFPIWLTFVAATHDALRMAHAPLPLLPGTHFFDNLKAVFHHNLDGTTPPAARMLINSMVMALIIAIGKIVISILSAFAIVYFRFPLRNFFFWLIFITLMLPVEVRILPTFSVASNLHLLNTYTGLTLPLIASATATFMFRQSFMTIPDELLEAAKIDGAGPLRFFWDIVLPVSRTTIAALFVIHFIYGWNQYLWPLLITTKPEMYTIVIGIKQMLDVAESNLEWNRIMMFTLLAMLPPVLVVVGMQKVFVKGLTETEK